MKWKLAKPRPERDEEEPRTTTTTTRKKKKQPSTSSNSSPSSSSSCSSSFSISHLFSLSWLASRLKSSKRTATAHHRPTGANVCSYCPSPPHSPPPPRQLQESNHGHPSATAHLAFRHAAALPACFPSPVVATDVLPRSSHVIDSASRPHVLEDARAFPRQQQRHHRSMGDLDLTLGHFIPLSVRAARAFDSDSGNDRSANGRQRWPQKPRRLRKVCKAAAAPSEADSRDAVLRRRSFSGRMRARAKVRVSSPPTLGKTAASAAAGRRRRTRRKRRRRRREAEDAAKPAMRESLEGFAVVKRSRDPQRDFRESMVEMIWEKRIGRPEELESLLACYLSLNAREHHDVIVKVFRQLWLELDPDGRFARSLE